jgi:hypothetical protein
MQFCTLFTDCELYSLDKHVIIEQDAQKEPKIVSHPNLQSTTIWKSLPRRDELHDMITDGEKPFHFSLPHCTLLWSEGF